MGRGWAGSPLNHRQAICSHLSCQSAQKGRKLQEGERPGAQGLSVSADPMQAPSGYMAYKVSTENITGPRVANSSSPDQQGAGAPHGSAGLPPPSPTRECQQMKPGPLVPTRSAFSLSSPREEGPSGLPRGAVVELGGHSVQGGEGPGHSCFENLFGLGIWEMWGREVTGGDIGDSGL